MASKKYRRPAFGADGGEEALPRRERPAAGKAASTKRRDRSVRVGRTPVGKGIFAQKSYQPGVVIGEIHGTVIHDTDYGSEYCMNIGEGRILEPDPPFRYVNHCCEPNCEFDWFDLAEMETDSPLQRRVFLIAIDRIRPGDELTIDYRWSAGAAIVCRCGAAGCRGWIVAAEQLPLLLNAQ